jgi:hypothetical protein
MTTYTVVLLYPDYSTEDFGADIFVEAADAEDAYKAAEKVQRIASEANDGDIPPEDFRPIAVMLGDIVLELDATSF